MPGMSGYEGCELSVEQLALLLQQDLKVALKKKKNVFFIYEKKHEGHIILAFTCHLNPSHVEAHTISTQLL